MAEELFGYDNTGSRLAVGVVPFTVGGSVLGAVLTSGGGGGGAGTAAGSVSLYDKSGTHAYFDGGRFPAWRDVGSVWNAGGSVNATVAGSVAVTNSLNIAAGSMLIIGGSVNINGAPSAWSGTGSVWIVGGSSNSIVAGSMAITTSPVPVSGNAIGLTDQSGVTIYLDGGKMPAWRDVGSIWSAGGSVNAIVAGSVGVTTDGLPVTPSGTFYSTVTQSGTWFGSVSGNVVGTIFVASGNAWVGTGSVVISGTHSAWTGVGSVIIASGTVYRWLGVGSVLVTGSVNIASNPVPVSGTANSTAFATNTLGASFQYYSGLSTTVQTVDASAGNLFGYYYYNPNTSTAYIQCFTGTSITLGTTTPQMVFGVPADAAANVSFSPPVGFATNLRAAAATTASGNGAVGTGLIVNFFYL